MKKYYWFTINTDSLEGEDSAVSGDEKMLLENYFVEKHIYDNKESIDFMILLIFLF